MQNNDTQIAALSATVDTLSAALAALSDRMDNHNHDGNDTQRVNVFDLFGLIQTSTTAGETTNRKLAKPLNIIDQIFIDTSTGTKKLYIYNGRGNAWLSVTIA